MAWGPRPAGHHVLGVCLRIFLPMTYLSGLPFRGPSREEPFVPPQSAVACSDTISVGAAAGRLDVQQSEGCRGDRPEVPRE